MKGFKFGFLLLLMIACQNPDNSWREKVSGAEPLHKTIKKVTDVIVHDIFSPPVASRIYVYTSIAAYETIIHQEPEFQSMSGQVHGLEPVPEPKANEEYCFELSAVKAALIASRALIFSDDKMGEFEDNIMQQFKESGMPSDIYERSLSYGEEVGKHILTWANGDNYKQTRSFPKYTVDNEALATWKPTPPAYMDGIEPHWNKIRTFLIDSANQFIPAPPTPFSIDKNSKFFEEAKEVMDIGNNLTDEQKQIARFWDCNPFMMNVKGHVMFATKKISPGGHWMNITHVACVKGNKSFVESAEAYSRVAIGLADGFISCWDEKYRSNLIRPETYINAHIDDKWTPLLQTPPFPEHTSGHSVISNAAAIILTDLFGDQFSFTDSTEVEFGLTIRSFNSFLEASDEAAISRLYGGIHYRPACMIGITEGRAVGNFVVSHLRTRKEVLAAKQ